MQEALEYLLDNPTLSFHHVAVKFGVNVSELQKAFQAYKIKEQR